ncbi:MAG TPA: PQQ-binding-like beta-propeller repeat protein, partial [Abditibacterium sp.]
MRSSTFLSGSFLLCTAPLWAQNGAPPAAPAAAPRSTVAWSTFKGDAQRTGFSSANVKLPLALTWRYTSEAPARSYITSPLVLGIPGRQRVVFGAGRNVYCLDVQTGAQVWRSPDLTSNIVTPLTLLSSDAGDLIIAAQQGGKVAALLGSNGERTWEGDALASVT